MNCQNFENVVSDLASSQIMEAEVRELALAHTNECVICKQRLQHEELLTRGLRALSMEVQSVQAPGDIELRLREAFQARPSLPPAAAAHAQRRYWLVAAAAILLVVFSALAVRWHVATPVPYKPEIVKTTSSSEKESPVNPDSATTAEKQRPVQKQLVANGLRKPKPHYRPHPAPAALQNSAVAINREVTTEFMPLGYLNPASLQDGGQIVRIELPRSKLASFGLPVNMERYNEKVKADVLMGVDGLAHAIRFVQ